MKMLLGGGWGYGNIGDDLILSSTISMLEKIDKSSEFTILTYSKSDSVAHKALNTKLEYTIHRHIDFNNTNFKFCSFNKSVSNYKKIMDRITKRISDFSPCFNYMSSKYYSEYESLFSKHDIYIMAGGGYFNEKWISKIRSQLFEIKLAQKLGLKTVILGPTIGKFPENISTEAREILSSVDLIVVRDDSSKNTLSSLGLECLVLPDIAMSDWEVEERHKNISKIGIAYTSGENALKSVIVNDLKKYALSKNTNIEIDFIITRQWKGDFLSAQMIMHELSQVGINTKLIIPSDHISLESEMAKFDIVISENLHGLISASRNLVPVIAINDYDFDSPNGKKFRGFLEQFGIEKYYINSKTKNDELLCLINDIENRYDDFTKSLSLKRQEVKNNYLSTLSKQEFLKSSTQK